MLAHSVSVDNDESSGFLLVFDHHVSVESDQAGVGPEILLMLGHQQGGDPLDEELSAGEGQDSPKQRLLLVTHLAFRGTIRVASKLITCQV